MFSLQRSVLVTYLNVSFAKDVKAD